MFQKLLMLATATLSAFVLAAQEPAAAGGSAPVAPRVAASSAKGASADWPQYRGPGRDGIAPAGPKLLDTWPKDGPPLLWKSAPLWPDKAGKAGCASVSIADGKAFTFAYVRRKTDKVVLTSKDMADWGWMDGVPADLAKKIEEERIHGKRAKLKPGPELDAYVKQYVAGLDPELAKKFGPWVQRQLTDPKTWVVSWAALTQLAPMRDKESSIEALGGSGWTNPIRSFLTDKVFRIFDTVICLDASTGKELWRKEFLGAPVHLTLDIGPSSTPTIVDGSCYVAGSAGMYCLSAKDGSVIWQAKTKFSHSSPLVMNGVCYCLVPEATAFDAKTGKVLWSEPTLKHTDSSFTKWTSGGKDYLIVAFEGGTYTKPPGAVFCLDPATGKGLWGTLLCQGCQTPVITSDDTLVLNGSNGVTKALKITPAKAELLWEAHKTEVPRGASPLVFQGNVYLAGACHSGQALRCLDLKTGEQKWNPGTFCAESSSPILADGKIIALPEETEQSFYVVMYRATPERYEELGRFNPHACPAASPAIAGGKLYLRLQDGVACYDLAQHAPYVEKTVAAKDKVTFVFKQAEGGLAANGPITGLTVTDASGKTTPAKASLNGTELTVNVKDVVFPAKIAYADGNLSAKNGPVAPFAWNSPNLMFERCEKNTLGLRFEHCVERAAWQAKETYTVVGAKVTGVELDSSGETLRLTTDRDWKNGEKVTVRYPALSPEPSARTVDLTFTVTPGRPVSESQLLEYLFDELHEKIDPSTVFDHDDLDKNTRPVAGGKWRLFRSNNQGFRLDEDTFPGRNCQNCFVHACVYVHSETDCKVQLSAAGWNLMQIFVNGQSVYRDLKSVPKKEIKDVQLKKGWNTVLLGLTHPDGGWSFSLSIRNEQGDGVPAGLRYTAEPPTEEAKK